LTAFALTETDEQIKATVEWCIDLPREAAAVADVGDDALITWVHDGHTVLGRANRHGVRECVRLPGSPVVLAASRVVAFVATTQPPAPAARLWRIDISTCRVGAELNLPSAEIDLQLDLSANWLTITDRAASVVCTVPATLATNPFVPPTSVSPRTLREMA